MLGETLALCAALAWSVGLILFKRSEAISPLGLNLFKNVTAAILLALTLPLLGQGIDWDRPPTEWAALCVSGVLGIAIADTAIFMALRVLGPALLAIVDCSYAPVIVILSIAFLDEQVGALFLLGAALVVAGVVLAMGEGASKKGLAALRASGRARGIALGLFGITSMGFGVVLAKPALERGLLVEVTLVRLLAGIAAQLVFIAASPRHRSALAVFRPSKTWKTLVPASILGAYVALLLWLGGFKWADASVAAVLNQMSSVFTIVLARVFLGEVLTRRRAVGGAAALAGAVVILIR